ncbi:hypothetical protein PNOK_0196300 [Pyrrhoderma noxium]|uniref:J domain-containing protein n=1 Tax=Pyrrhoderma noxium TaxID=2282107 RepID=A0A286UQY6_9AGAM|nr:hypothetical protein PNOK_0196300 [Pyrrhoderma noxium]
MSFSSSFPDYYALLGVQNTATQAEIRQAYKRESLKSHPDRLVNASPEQKRLATEKFQAVADAYYVLSDPERRREYDTIRRTQGYNGTADPGASANFFANFASMFTSNNASGEARRPDAEGVFGDVFEELLRPEVERVAPFWSWLGIAAGASLGFIIANFYGLLIGGFAGRQLGAIRDAKGKSVAAVFSQLGGNQKAEILRALAAKVLGAAGSAI